MTELPIDKLDPNPWNPNRMDSVRFKKLVAYLEREGFVVPIVVRPGKRGRYQIIDGEHRYRAAKELGLPAVPCEVVDLDDRRAKILTINLNRLRGEHAPAPTAALLHDLSMSLSAEDIASQTPYSRPEIEDYLALLQVPDTLLDLESEAAEHERNRGHVISIACDNPALVEEALREAQERAGGEVSRGAALEAVCAAFLGKEGG